MLPLVLFGLASAGNHTTLSFDYGWRFHLGDPAITPPSPSPPPPPGPPPAHCTFAVNASGFAYNGLSHGSGATAEACAAFCCAQGKSLCVVWQFLMPSPDGKKEPLGKETGGCWIGYPGSKRADPNGWVGAMYAGAIPPAPPPSPPASPDTPLAMPMHPAAAAVGFDDSGWRPLDLPHDYIVEQTYDENTPGDGDGSRGGAGESYLPRDVAYYRKHFELPAQWEGTVVWIYFEGVFRATKIWLNGVAIAEHAAFVGDAHGEGGGAGMGGGYTSFSVRLDNCSAVEWGGKNVLTVYTDPRKGSGWFYEGGGIYRQTWLHSAPPVHIETDGIYAVGKVTLDNVVSGATPAVGDRAASATVEASAELVNAGETTTAGVAVTFELFDADGNLAGKASPAKAIPVPAATSTSVPAKASSGTVSIAVGHGGMVELWSVARPYLYTLVVTLSSGDSKNVSIGLYSTKWTGDRGFFVNDQHVKIRGFCNHESFGGVGMAIPDRVNLFRAQALRSVGANGWRMSHNPVSPGLYDILDRVGVVAMDESRILSTDDISIMNMGAMVKRDRNHPSVVIWSYCNEGGCGKGGAGFRNITLKYDTSRPTLGNRLGFDDADTDVEGFSHKGGDVFDTYHAAHPTRPKFASECCSCTSMRGEGNPTGPGLANKEGTLSCTASQSNRSNSRPFMAGTMVWTLFDYYGESHGWPRVSSAYGQIDLAGFFKLTGYWYRTFWLSAVPETDAGRPVGFGAAHSCHVYTETSVHGVRKISILTEANRAELYINGTLNETAQAAPLEAIEFITPIQSLATSNVTVVCIGSDGAPTVPPQRIAQAGNATAIVLSLDAPSVLTGTGSSLVLDGHDVAMLRAEVVDAAGELVKSSSANVTFTVTAGPGRVIASHNGDNACHEPNGAAWHSAFVGLVRAFVRVTEDRAGSVADRTLLASIDTDTAHTTVPTGTSNAPTSIVVTASSPGLKSAMLTIPVSTSSAHDVLSSARSSLQTVQNWA